MPHKLQYNVRTRLPKQMSLQFSSEHQQRRRRCNVVRQSVPEPDVCLSRTSGLSRERKTKIGTEVAHVTRDSDTTVFASPLSAFFHYVCFREGKRQRRGKDTRIQRYCSRLPNIAILRTERWLMDERIACGESSIIPDETGNSGRINNTSRRAGSTGKYRGTKPRSVRWIALHEMNSPLWSFRIEHDIVLS